MYKGAIKTGPVYNPALSAPLCGYQHIQPIDDGTAAHLLQPGSEGFGMMVWDMAKHCGSCGDTVTTWLLPAVARWRSVVAQNGYIDESVARHFLAEDYPDGPIVGISELWVPEDYEYLHYSETVTNNLDLPDEVEEDNEIGLYLDVGYLLGVMPVFNIVPIDPPFAASWIKKLRAAWDKNGEVFSSYHACNCSFDGWTSDDCLLHQWEKKYEDVITWAWNDKGALNERWKNEAECQCAMHGFMREYWELVAQTPNYVDETGDDLLGKTWDYALDRYLTSWKWFTDHSPTFHTMTERNAWRTSFSRRWSPYLARSGLEDYLQTHGLLQYAA